MKYAIELLLSLVITLAFISCHSDPSKYDFNEPSPEFKEHWFDGKAEVAVYNLSQSRYGEERKGKATLIFVTEPFSRYKQVKIDHAEDAGNDKVNVMKLNFVKKFTTGVYPYSMMLSAFTPVELQKDSSTFKVSMSSQEWCGHTFAQLNLNHDKYKVSLFSYFETEGDEQVETKKVMLEDEVWSRIRIDYESLPQGEFEMLPGLFYTRLQHKPLEPEVVNASLIKDANSGLYKLEFEGRTLEIVFNLKFPHEITAWKETFVGRGGKQYTTSAQLDRKLFIDYWTKNHNQDAYLRDSLNLN
ncbi:hypothetical protein [Fulvivirga ligni]|uniref:hypothetical protein n=1 Tax=Fulvivirga ligni TaxID=2904246 RepID=UPI001F2F93AE|nr:hypothetical protein [Fulvivirga ligni]UII22180.1 hypothetical protein LVD16_02905 [Fulvivirga ligni]